MAEQSLCVTEENDVYSDSSNNSAGGNGSAKSKRVMVKRKTKPEKSGVTKQLEDTIAYVIKPR